MEKVFETPDLYLSAAIVTLLKSEPAFKVKNNHRIVFCFTISDDLYRAITAYNSGTPVDVQEYAGNLRRLRGEMLNCRYKA